MPDMNVLTPENVLKGASPLVLTATFTPVGGLGRFQPAGFPEVGHVIYKAPRKDGGVEHVCIVDSSASMANHLESVCMRGAHDYDLVDDLAGMPYVRCVTGALDKDDKLLDDQREVVVTTLTEGHRLASTYFLEGQMLNGDGSLVTENGKKQSLQDVLVQKFGIVLANSKKAHPPAGKWWDVFGAMFQYDPNTLVHGVLFPKWQIKIPRVLTAHLEAIGAGRVDRSGVKFDRLGKTTSGQPIFAVDDATAREIRATFILDVALVKSFGRETLGLAGKQQEFLVALALWKIQRLLAMPFRFRSGCHLQCDSLMTGDKPVSIEVGIGAAIENAGFTIPSRITDVWWPRGEIYREGENKTGGEGEEETQEDDE